MAYLWGPSHFDMLSDRFTPPLAEPVEVSRPWSLILI